MKVKLIILYLLMFAAALPCFATVYYVDGDNGENDNDGLSWDTAKKSLQEGIEAAAAGATSEDSNEVWVKAGTYKPDSWPNISDSTEDREKHFSLRNNVAVYGGFSGTETDLTARNPETNVCILSGDIGVVDDSSDNSYHVFYHPDAAALEVTALLDGFTVSGGNADASTPHDSGGGVYNSSSSPTLENCTISENVATYGGGVINDNHSSPTLTSCAISKNSAFSGGGLCNIASSLLLTNCTIFENSASYGGGMYTYNSTLTLESCTISANAATSTGGGMRSESAWLTLTSCTISENTAVDGGGVWNSFTSPSLEDCTISENSASGNGGGMYNKTSSSPTMTNCAISKNSASGNGGGMYNSSSSPTITNCTISENTASNYGGGMHNSSSSPILTDCTISENSNTKRGGGMYNTASSPTLTNCTISGNSASLYGAGMANYASSSPTLEDCMITENSSSVDGGGIYNYESSLTMTSSTVSWSEADYGAGLYNYNSTLTLTACTISKNKASYNGGGMRNESSSLTMTSCTISGNEADIDGGGMFNINDFDFNSDSPTPSLTNCTISGNSAKFSGGGMLNYNNTAPELINCTISGNRATYWGGGMSNNSDSRPTLTNCTISGNEAGDNGDGIFNYHSAFPTLKNCIVWGNGTEIVNGGEGTPVITYSIIQDYPDTPDNDGNFGSDPLLEPLTDNGGLVETMALGEGSAAIGEALIVEEVTEDARGITRDETPDIGAFEAVPAILIELSTTSVNESDGTITGTVTRISGGTTGLLTVSLSSSDADEVSVPESIDIRDGETSADFTITIIDDTTAGSNSQVTITASADGYLPDTSPELSILDDAVTLNVSSTTGGSANTNGESTVTMDEEVLQDLPLEAISDPGRQFVGWSVESGTGSIADPDATTTTIAFSTDVTVKASFVGVYYVDGDAGNDNNDGFSWDTAKQTLQVAIDAAPAASSGLFEVWVKAGTYTPDSWPNIPDGTEDREKHFSLRNNVAVYGGFSGTEVERSSRSPETNVCILSGDIGVADNDEDNCYHVFYHPDSTALDETAVLDGFTVSGGNADASSPHVYGGGVYNNNSSPTLTNCTISDNSATAGGGICNYVDSSPTMTNCTISDNSASTGGGMYNIAASSPRLTNCTISGNVSSISGGGINSYESSPTLKNCTISANSAEAYGGGVYNNYYSETKLTNCTISGNTATIDGGAMRNFNSSKPTLTNCILWDNGTEVSDSGGSAAVIMNSIIQDYSGSPDDGNFSSNPLLGALVDNGGLVHTMALGENSPAIDKGLVVEGITKDARGITRDSNPDIGAFESVPAIILALSTTSVNENDGTITGTVTRLSDGTTGLLTVSLSSSDINEVTVPETVDIPDGETSAEFSFAIIDDATAGNNPHVTITASAAGYAGDTSAAITIEDDSNLLTLLTTTGGIANSGGQSVLYVDEDAAASIEAVPGSYYRFTEWTVEDGSAALTDSTAESTTVTLTADATIQAIYAQNTLEISLSTSSVSESDGTITGTITRDSGTSGALIVSLSTSEVDEATVPATVSIPDTQDSVEFSITLIDDATIGTNPDVTISADAENHIGTTSQAITIADDTPTTLTISAGTGGTAVSSGTQSVTDDPEASILVTATPTLGYYFVNWTLLSGTADFNSDYPVTTVIVSSDAEIQANFAVDNDPPVAISMALPASASVGDTVFLSGSGSYDPDNAPITYGWSFVNAVPATITAPTLSDATSMEATFTPTEAGTYIFELTVSDGADSDSDFVQVVISQSFTITANAGIGGNVRFGLFGTGSSSATEDIAAGDDSSILYAIADTGYEFTGWNDGSTDNPRQFLDVDTDATVTANFAVKTYTVTFVASTGGLVNGETTQSQSVEHGGPSAEVTATADEGYEFAGWTVDGAEYSTEPTITVTDVQSDMTIVAELLQDTPSGGSYGGEDDAGCGCAAGESNSVGGLLLVLLGLMVFIRIRYSGMLPNQGRTDPVTVISSDQP